MTIKYIFSDIDGTLLNSHGQVSMTNKRIIQSCSQPLTLVSARAQCYRLSTNCSYKLHKLLLTEV
ncbi:MAG: HAD hydrolase family protein [Lactobacillus sp.]|nr:HAD hydrolase family protein [Lactobacillus sp.]